MPFAVTLPCEHTLAGGVVGLSGSSTLVLHLVAGVVRCIKRQFPMFTISDLPQYAPLFLMVLVCSARKAQVSTLQSITFADLIEALCGDLQPGPHLQTPRVHALRAQQRCGRLRLACKLNCTIRLLERRLALHCIVRYCSFFTRLSQQITTASEGGTER